MPKDGILSSPLMADSRERDQIRLEEESIAMGIERYRQAREATIKRGDGGSIKAVDRLVAFWHDSLEHTVAREVRAVKNGRAAPGRDIYGPVLAQIKPEHTALIMLREGFSRLLQHPSGMKFTKFSYSLGRAIVAEANAALARKVDKERWEAAKEDGSTEARNYALHYSFSALTRNAKRLTPQRINWWVGKNLDDNWTNNIVCARLGAWMAWQLVDKCVLPAQDGGDLPGFRHELRRAKKKTVGWMVLTKHAKKIIADGDMRRQILRPRFMPMIMPPCSWIDPEGEPKDGGYVKIKPPLIASSSKLARRLVVEHDMTAPLKCLNAINAAPRRVNRDILDLVDGVYDDGGGEVGIPLKHDLPIPPRLETGSEQELRTNRADRRHAYKMNQNILPSLRQTHFLQMDVARRFKDRNAIWFPHRFDFRGRVYPKPQPFNHQGPDVCRAMIEWSRPVPVTDVGRRWLMIHAANCFGVDKVPVEDRVAWAEGHMADIRRTAADARNDGWWRDADAPFQFVAACMAIADPEKAAHIVVDIDGKCNGMAHYAALGRDTNGATETSLVPADKPGDIYTTVTDKVRQWVEAGAKGGNELAVAVLPYVTRQVCKRVVMTYCYSVTFYGASTHIRDELKAAGMDKRWMKEAPRYLSRLVLDAVEQVCESAASIMGWLKDAADAITALNEPVVWIAPSGFPVGQSYYSRRQAQIKTELQQITMQVQDEDKNVDRRKQRSAIAPNYIHSIDASHMLAVAIKAHETGMDFSGIHDSFGTHAEHMDALGEVVREEFVALHRRDLLGELRDQLQERFSVELAEPPAKGNFDIESVLDSTYSFL